MAYKLVNKTNGMENTKHQTEPMLTLEDFANEALYLDYLENHRNFAKEMFKDNLKLAKSGKIFSCDKWEQVEEILECFDNNDEWIIEELNAMFYVNTNPSNTRQLNTYKRFKQALLKGEIVDIEDDR